MKKRFFKNSDSRKISGVCAGLSEYFDIDVTIVRLITFSLILFTNIFWGIIFYFILSCILPDKSELDFNNKTSESETIIQDSEIINETKRDGGYDNE
ncbi:PspC domain-containing protein [Clostridium septicum]|uniref:PspC domain-containing protein n=1 Tax=Clostridium septicum TaxID=1504 RepID=A0A9N7PJX3_CLOSE|nr:PspC domain-containing protein [Clostridium septicum]AYE35040.1 PspC domain-containing protein [Clostridium septicum]MDU1312629.1 PspC domain-containing protein [Clostridium septicum]QAS60433.1 PspC domain-containing protein [Clostridium septicum]UEC20310.1 PspC domain-containing protein [Clostridium septicum]USS01638.1 PspC domain-containing protein [Clostridium septicum]